MVTVTITVAAFVALSVATYLTLEARKQAADYKAKFESTKEFADEAAKTILKLEQSRKDLSNTIVLMKSEIAAMQISKEPVAKEVKPQVTDAVTSKKPAGKKRGPKPGRQNQSK